MRSVWISEMSIICLDGIKQTVFMMETLYLLSNLPTQEGQVHTAWEPPKLEIFAFPPQNVVFFFCSPSATSSSRPPLHSSMLQWVNIHVPAALWKQDKYPKAIGSHVSYLFTY
jgi:hypothetical protein